MVLLRAIDETAGADVGIAETLEHLGSAIQPKPRGKVRRGGSRFRERTGLMTNPAHRDAHQSCLQSKAVRKTRVPGSEAEFQHREAFSGAIRLWLLTLVPLLGQPLKGGKGHVQEGTRLCFARR